ncbi:MAG: chain-length determining protein [Bacteroidales bacterium]|nr:chain-length determining protein [Candidatus Cacconaster merdequi]
MENINQKQNSGDIIDLRKIYHRLKEKKRQMLVVAAVAFVLSCIWIIPEPRIYRTDVTLAPEAGSSGMSSLGSLASSFGISLSGMSSSDAIYPTLYPDIMQSTDFVIGLFEVPIKTLDGTEGMDYYTYLLPENQKTSIFKRPFFWIIRKISDLRNSDDSNIAGLTGTSGSKYETFFYSQKQADMIKKIRENIKCSVDKKTSVISISVFDQDRLVCASMADTVCSRLQNYIIDYRTHKARIDLDYYSRLTVEAEEEYEKAIARYSDFSDSNINASLESVKSKKAALNNELQIKQSVYNAAAAQYQAAMAKLQENTPSFTVIQPSIVPQKAFKPKRKVFVLAMTMLAVFASAIWFTRDILIGREQ